VDFSYGVSTNRRYELGVRRTLFLAGAAVAVAAVISAGTQASADTVDAAPAGVTANQVSADDLRSVLTPADVMAPGTQVTQLTIADAVAAGKFQAPADVVITPTVCTNLVDLSTVRGWVQLGHGQAGHVELSLAGVVPGGFDLDQLRANAEACQSGTVTVAALGLKGTISLTEFTAPAVDGMKTVGIHQVVSFAGHDSDIARQLESTATSSQVYFTDEREFGGAICIIEPVNAGDRAVAMQERVKALIG